MLPPLTVREIVSLSLQGSERERERERATGCKDFGGCCSSDGSRDEERAGGRCPFPGWQLMPRMADLSNHRRANHHPSLRRRRRRCRRRRCPCCCPLAVSCDPTPAVLLLINACRWSAAEEAKGANPRSCSLSLSLLPPFAQRLSPASLSPSRSPHEREVTRAPSLACCSKPARVCAVCAKAP